MQVERDLATLRSDDRLSVAQIPYRFSTSIADQGRVSLRKVVAAGAVLGRLLRLRLSGRIDVFLHPIGGPSRSSTARDIVLLPAITRLCDRTILRFHGAGHGRDWAGDSSLLVRLARRVLGRCDAAVVQSEANRIDPDWLGIKQLFVIPYALRDQLDTKLVRRSDVDSRIGVLYVGHLGPHRGTPQLIDAVAALSEEIPGLELDLVGETAYGYDETELRRHIHSTACQDRIRYHGTVVGEAKLALFGRAHIFAFPSVFEAESFGLVLAEGLMWGLPVIATDWRANREVLSGAPDVVVHPYRPNLQEEIVLALRAMATAVRRAEVPTFSAANRAAFERRYLEKQGPSALADAIVALTAPGHRARQHRAGAADPR
jgi:glycosyltransferase involved in cell wall biosynthesis